VPQTAEILWLEHVPGRRTKERATVFAGWALMHRHCYDTVKLSERHKERMINPNV